MVLKCNIMIHYKSSKKEVKCKYCGSNAIVDTSVVLTSDPPQYNVDCPNCGRVYIPCSYD